VIERDPEVISSDVDIAARVGQELFLDEKIRRHQSSRRYVRIVEHTVLKEKELRTPVRTAISRRITALGA
jgi:hypothetical protein